jgi:hypothetical protein
MWYPEIDGSAILVENLTLQRGAGWQSIFCRSAARGAGTKQKGNENAAIV